MTYPDIFDRCIKVVLKNEGGYVNHPSDPGGETNFGIAKKFYPDLDIKNLTKEKAIEIYYKDYWTPMNLELIADADIILQLFDFGVNAGRKMATRLIQRVVGVDDDGIIGDETLAAINNYDESLLDKFKRRRKMFYMNLASKKPQLEVFLRGWIRRVDNTKF